MRDFDDNEFPFASWVACTACYVLTRVTWSGPIETWNVWSS